MSRLESKNTEMDSREPPGQPDLSALKIDEQARRGGAGSKWLRWFAAGVGGLLVISAVVFALKSNAPVVELATARAGGEASVALLNASGYVTPRRRATVAAKITGRVQRVLVDEGMRVEQGQVLARLDDSDARVRRASAIADRDATAASVADLRVNLANAQVELRRAEQLHQGGIGTQEALDAARTTYESYRARIAQAEAQVQAAQARTQEAQQDMDNCIVRAPFAGMVVAKDAQPGEMVSPISAGGGFTRTGIATIVDMKSLEIEVDVNESYIARVQPGQPVVGVLDAYPDWEIPGKVRTIIPTADRQKATVKVRIAFDRLDPRILPDMGVKVTFLGEEPGQARRSKSSLWIPQGAVRQEESKPVVYLYHDGRVERRAVRIGEGRSNDAEVLAGLAPGDQVVLKGPEGLRDGERVKVKP